MRWTHPPCWKRPRGMFRAFWLDGFMLILEGDWLVLVTWRKQPSRLREWPMTHYTFLSFGSVNFIVRIFVNESESAKRTIPTCIRMCSLGTLTSTGNRCGVTEEEAPIFLTIFQSSFVRGRSERDKDRSDESICWVPVLPLQSAPVFSWTKRVSSRPGKHAYTSALFSALP